MARADTMASAPSLGISQLKITSSNGQFITLYNLTGTSQDLSSYQLEYFNSYDVSKATSSKLIALSGILPPHSYYVLNDGTYTMCYQAVVNSVSLGLSSTAGLIELIGLRQVAPGGLLQPQVQDYAAWSKTAVSGVQLLPSAASAFLVRQSPYTMESSWLSVQPDTNNICNLVTTNNEPLLTESAQLLPALVPKATIINSAQPVSQTVGIPAADNGLVSPKITELLPNPEGTGNDATDEFIELYNPNSVVFDLSGFRLQTGLTSTHNYIFPAGTTLPPNSFTGYYSAVTKLSLSNSGGQAALIDPLGRSVDQSGAYGSADDGQAWTLADGKWYWTASPTPGAANVIKQPAPAKTKKVATTTAGSLKPAVKTTKHATNSGSIQGTQATPVQPWVLALIGGLALLYGAYEYRHDLANRVQQLKRYLPPGRANRSKLKGRRGDRVD